METYKMTFGDKCVRGLKIAASVAAVVSATTTLIIVSQITAMSGTIGLLMVAAILFPALVIPVIVLQIFWTLIYFSSLAASGYLLAALIEPLINWVLAEPKTKARILAFA